GLAWRGSRGCGRGTPGSRQGAVAFVRAEESPVSVRVGLNGFGRTGRAFYRAIVERSLDVEVVAVNDLGSATALARLLQRDSVHGPLPEKVAVEDGSITVGSRTFEVLHEPEPKELPWGRLGVDVAVEASGRFT